MAEEVANLCKPSPLLVPEKKFHDMTKFIAETSASLPIISNFASNLTILLHNERNIYTAAIHQRFHFSYLYYIL